MEAHVACRCCSPPADDGLDTCTDKRDLKCCDDTCLEIAAQQECAAHREDCQRRGTGPLRADCCASRSSKATLVPVANEGPCDKHLQVARERYATTLQKVGCICKALITRNLESCCSSIRNRKKRCFPAAASSRPVESTGVCASAKWSNEKQFDCGSEIQPTDCEKGPCGDTSECCAAEDDICGKSISIRRQRGDYCGDTTDSCRGKSVSPQQDRQKAACCGAGNPKVVKDNCCSKVDDCCDKIDVHPVDQNATLVQSPHDIEKGRSILEHVTLSVEGLTCVGCENKLIRALDAIPGVYNRQTSLVLCQAEFDVGSDAKSVDRIIEEVTKATGFACKQVFTGGCSVDVLVPGDPKAFIEQQWPSGVEGMIALDKHAVRITYNPKLVGARDLLYRCFSAVIELAPRRPSAELESGAKHLRQMVFMSAFSAALTIPVLVLAWAPLPKHDILYGALSLSLATIVQVVVAGPFYPSALRALIFTRVIEMDLLIVLSTSSAYIFSLVAFAYQLQGRPLPTGEFFETSTLLVTFIMLGRLASAFARHKAVESISVRSLQTETALLVGDENGSSHMEIDARLLQYGDIFKVMPDSRIVTDGIVVAGESEVSESNITGESLPVGKSKGSAVIAGSLNGAGMFVVRLTRLPSENTISEIAALVDAAKFSKPKMQQLADRVAAYFVPVIVILTVITFVIWTAVDIDVRRESKSAAVVQAITYAISVLIVSCPCGIGLAVPMVAVIAGGVGARHGVLFKSAETIEEARKVSHVVFDKTGTLTQGKLSVSAEEYMPGSHPSTASLALGLTVNSQHPVSTAVAAHLQVQGIEPVSISNVKSIAGCGMEGDWNGRLVCVGNSRWLNLQHVSAVADLQSQGLTALCVSLDGELLAVYGLDDSLRPDAMSVVSELRQRHITVSLVSGDDDSVVQRIGHELGIPSSHIRSRCSPEDKQKYVKSLMDEEGRIVLFCGDGTNDAVALAQAHIGLHMSSGTDIAQSAADAVLTRPALSGILCLIDLSRASYHRIMFNFCWAFVYNTFAVLLAAGAFVNARIPPRYAGLGELVSVLPVILVALQLRWFKSS